MGPAPMRCLTLVAAAAAFLSTASASESPSTLLWPVPQAYQCTDGNAPVSPVFSVTTSTSNTVLTGAIARYQTLYQNLVGAGEAAPAGLHATPVLTTMTIAVTDASGDLNPSTSFKYKIEFSPSSTTVTVTADTVYGAIAAMETFSQLFNAGVVVATACTINDYPAYPHRGFLVDSGRRFVPVPLLKNFIDMMSYSKMNVLHLHLSDWAGVRFAVDAYPELTAGLNGQFYTAADAADLVAYAKYRAVRIVPEIDVPSHASGFAPLISAGLSFCDSTNTQLYNDPSNNKTLAVVVTVLTAVAQAFPDALFHLGGDETSVVNDTGCTIENIHTFEQALQEAIASFKATPVVWNEVWSVPVNTEPNGALPGTIIQNWHASASSNTTAAGFGSLVSTYNQFYLDQQCCMAGPAGPSSGTRLQQCYWTDISQGVAAANMGLLYGGEAAMWSDMYCGGSHCPQTGPWSIWYDPEFDSQFGQSFAGLAWPRAAVAGGSLWNYEPTLDPTSAQFAALVTNHNNRLATRVGANVTCPNGCTCDWNSRCGTPYGATPPLSTSIKLTNSAGYKVTVKEATPCMKTYGDVLAILQPGDSYVVTTDFIVVSAASAGDPFDLWFGGPGWMADVASFDIQVSAQDPEYLEYVVTSQG